MKAWFSALRVSHKLMLISIFFVMPDSLMLYLFITGMNENIHFAQKEKKGNEYQRPLEGLLEWVPQHRLFGRRKPEESGLPSAVRVELEAKIDGAFAALKEVDARIGADLQFTPEGLAKRKRERCSVEAVTQEWNQLKALGVGVAGSTWGELHQHLISDLRTMITHAGDQSNLILDPDLDSYYLMDATLLALPEAQDRLAAVMAHGQTALEEGALSDRERQQFAIYATLLKEADLDRIRRSLQTALNEDENFYGTSPSLQLRVRPALEAYAAAAQALIQFTDRLVQTGPLDVSLAQYLTAGTKARNASFNLWRIADEELDQLLQRRISSYEHRRARSLIVAGCAVLAAIGFVSFITRSISGPLRLQAEKLGAVNLSLQQEMAERTRAEEELRRSEAQLAAAQKIARMGSWGWDTASDTIVWSEENYRIHGVDRAKVAIGYQTALQLIHPLDRASANDHFLRAARDLHPFSFEHRIVLPDGTERIIHQRGDVLRDALGSVRVFGTAQDITDRKRAEEELEKVHKELLETSRQAGMAEVATGILHNVGNVLNSVNVSVSLLRDIVRLNTVEHLTRTTGLLREQRDEVGRFLASDPRGKNVPSFLIKLADQIGLERKEFIKELTSLTRNVEHIKEVVAMQQSYARISGTIEPLSPASVVDDALRMNEAGLSRHRAEVVREFESMPPIPMDKNKVLQILINLISNAKYAVSASLAPEKRVTVRVRNVGGDRVQMQVEDTGVGISKENIARVFSAGFTTKKDGHGFGLHSSANAAKAMGGRLFVDSPGPGQGAVFTLELPILSQPTASACPPSPALTTDVS